MTESDAVSDAAYRERRLAVVATALALFWLAAAAVQFADATMDDAFISLRYVRHLVERGSLAFNPGAAPVEGVTNLGWVLLLAPFALAMPAPLAAKAVGAAAAFAAVALAARLGWRAAGEVTGRWAVAAGAALGLAASFEFSFFALAGMETGALAALLLVLAALAERDDRRSAVALGVGAAAAFLIRPEAALALPIYLALRWRRGDAARRAALRPALVAFAACVVAIELARLAWFGSLVPNTAH